MSLAAIHSSWPVPDTPPKETEGQVTFPAPAEAVNPLETDKAMVGGIRYAPPSGRNGNRIPVGAHPWNTGGKKGRSGRRSEKLVAFLAELRQSPELYKSLIKIAKNPRSRNFPAS